MIIFTGMDNSGKTTLAKKFSEETGLPLVKSIGPNHSPSEKKVWVLDQMVRETIFPFSTAFDRFLPFEELVYGKVLRGDTIFELDDSYMNSLKSLNPTIIYTRPPSEVIFQWGSRDQMSGVIEKQEELLKAWDDLILTLKSRGWQVYTYDYTSGQSLKEFMGPIALQIIESQIKKATLGDSMNRNIKFPFPPAKPKRVEKEDKEEE